MLGDPGQGVPEDKRHWHEPRTSSNVASDRPQKFFISEDMWTTEFVAGLICSTCAREEPGDRLCDIFDVDRLQLCLTPAEHRVNGKRANQLHQRREKGVIGSEHNSRADQDCVRKGRLHDLFAVSACADVGRRRIRIGADTGDMCQPINPGFVRQSRQPCCGLDVQAMKGALAALDVEARLMQFTTA